MRALPHHYECSAAVWAKPEKLFEYVDDHARLSSHMSESSWTLGGGRMMIEYDRNAGTAIGSRLRLSGRVFGLALAVEEVVTERQPPRRKV